MGRLEVVDLRNPRGIAKVLGTLVSLGGAMVMTFYKGPIIRNLWHPLIHMQHTATHHVHENWLKGSVLTVSSCISWALSYIMQGIVGSALVVYIQLWCTEKKGPVFATMYSPLGAVLVALLAYFVLGQRLYVGSIVGGVIVVVGLYLLLWGKEDEHMLQDESIASKNVSQDEP
ncbi:WAT1-related protein, partial [Cucurbita argyrosperma subsp. argyrosperma]